MLLNKLINNAPVIEIEQLSTDSRIPMKNAIFFCLDGIKYDGHKYIDEAIKNGAIVVIYNKEIIKNNNAIYIKVNNVNETLYNVAEKFFDYPNKDINKFIVSGCYGRCSVSHYLKHFLNKKSSCGSIGILGINYKDKNLSLTFPALPALENMAYLKRMKENNIKNCVFETSAISLYYKKMDVIKPDVFIYTNTSKICSDFQVSNNQYYSYYRRYFYTLEENTCVVLNRDDESYFELKDSISNYVTYGTNDMSTYRIDNIDIKINSISFDLVYNNNIYHVNSNLLGLANVYNLVSAIVGLHQKGYEIEDIINGLEDVKSVDGVFEKIDDKYNVIIDCADEIDSLKNIMEYATKTKKGKIIGVIGINYSDDDLRIKQIINLCNNYLDVVILTENESQAAEVTKILDRTDKYADNNKTIKITFRSVAIENAIEIMNENDTLLILGKGNEKYFTLGLGKDYYAGDKHYALKYLKNRKEYNYETI